MHIPYSWYSRCSRRTVDHLKTFWGDFVWRWWRWIDSLNGLKRVSNRLQYGCRMIAENLNRRLGFLNPKLLRLEFLWQISNENSVSIESNSIEVPPHSTMWLFFRKDFEILWSWEKCELNHWLEMRFSELCKILKIFSDSRFLIEQDNFFKLARIKLELWANLPANLYGWDREKLARSEMRQRDDRESNAAGSIDAGGDPDRCRAEISLMEIAVRGGSVRLVTC